MHAQDGGYGNSSWQSSVDTWLRYNAVAVAAIAAAAAAAAGAASIHHIRSRMPLCPQWMLFLLQNST